MTILNRPGSFVLPKLQHLFFNTNYRGARKIAALERDRQKLIERNAYLEQLRSQHRIVWDYRERTITPGVTLHFSKVGQPSNYDHSTTVTDQPTQGCPTLDRFYQGKASDH